MAVSLMMGSLRSGSRVEAVSLMDVEPMKQTVVVIGLGEVGKPLLAVLQGRYQTFGVDIDLPAPVTRCDVMHVCFPFQNGTLVEQVLEYIDQYRPALTIINSTVAPGTTRSIAVESGTAVVHSPVRVSTSGCRRKCCIIQSSSERSTCNRASAPSNIFAASG